MALSESKNFFGYNRIMLVRHNNPLALRGFLGLVVCGSNVDHVLDNRAYDEVIPCMSFRRRNTHFIQLSSNLKLSPTVSKPLEYLPDYSGFILAQY